MQRPLQWEKEFLRNLDALPFANRAWQRLTRAGLGDITKVHLYELHAFGDSVPMEISKKDANAIQRLKALQYAQRKAREREHDPKAANFREKLRQKADAFAKTEWPYRNPEVKTYADAALIYPEIGSMLIERAGAEMGQARQNLVRYSGKMLLAVLRAGAQAHGVSLSLMQLVELADAAHPTDPPLEKNTLQRFLKSAQIKRAECGYRQLFEALLRQLRDPEKAR